MTEIRHKKLLKEIQAEHGSGNDDRRLDQIAVGQLPPAYGETEGDNRDAEESRRATQTDARAHGGLDQLASGAHGPDINQSQGRDGNGRESQETVASPGEIAAEEDRKKKLHAARQRRYADKKKQEQAISDETAAFSEPFEPESSSARQSQRHKLSDVKLKFRHDQEEKAKELADVKLIAANETDDSIEKIADLFIRGSVVIDQILQIIIKGHDEVHIWELDELTATTIATIQVEAARKDKAAARTVRQLVQLHKKLFALSIFGPRILATGVLMKEKGLGFK